MCLKKNITITGALGSGKSLVCTKLREALGFDVISVGKIQRKLAEKYKMTTTDFNIYMETHPEIDVECDDMVAKLGKEKSSTIFDSRLAWHFVESSFKIYLSVEDGIAANRVYNDKGRINESYTDATNAKQKIKERRESEVLRFRKQYAVDLEDYANYDLVIDTSYATPENIARVVFESYRKFVNNEEYQRIWLSPKIIIPYINTPNDTTEITTPLEVIKVGAKGMFYTKKRIAFADETTLIPIEIIAEYDKLLANDEE